MYYPRCLTPPPKSWDWIGTDLGKLKKTLGGGWDGMGGWEGVGRGRSKALSPPIPKGQVSLPFSAVFVVPGGWKMGLAENFRD